MLYNQQLINPPHPPQVSISICRLEIQSPSGAPSYFPVSKWTWLGLCSASMSNDFHLKRIFVPGRWLHLLFPLFILLSFSASPGLGIGLSDLQLTSLAPGPHQPLENPMLLKLLSNCKIHSFSSDSQFVLQVFLIRITTADRHCSTASLGQHSQRASPSFCPCLRVVPVLSRGAHAAIRCAVSPVSQLFQFWHQIQKRV